MSETTTFWECIALSPNVPPIRRARRRAAGTENALVHAVQLGPIFSRLQIFGLPRFLGLGGLQPGFNGTVLFVKVGHIGHQVLEDKHVWQGINLGGLGGVFLVNVGKTSQGVDAVNIHGTGTTDSLTAGTTKSERGVLFVFDFDQGIEDHGSALIQVDGVGGKIGPLVLFRIPTVDFKVFDTFGLGRSRHVGDLE